MMHLENELRRYFGFEHFKPGQEAIIENVIKDTHTLGVLPTGSGKSLCYQLPTYIKQKPTLIISPLISLMDDQVAQMKMNGEERVIQIHSGLSESERYQHLKRLHSSRFIYMSPEFLLQPHNLRRIENIDFGLIVLDEAHCISEWGYDFRPHYVLIQKAIKRFKNATILALTATKPPYLAQDLERVLGLELNEIMTTMNRDNIMLSHRNCCDQEEKMEWLTKQLSESGPTIVYVSSKKMCHEIAKRIYEAGYLTGIYHADLSYEERFTVQQQFLANDISIIVATSAFGMGINKKDIRTIIHFHLPANPANYLQEIGRTGRDGGLSQAISLYQPDDYYLLETLIFSDMITSADIEQFELGTQLPEPKHDQLSLLSENFSIRELKHIFETTNLRKEEALMKMMEYTRLNSCRRTYLLSYFNDQCEQAEYCCDNCDNIIPIQAFNRKKVLMQYKYSDKLKSLFLK